MEFVDTHTHLYLPEFAEDIELVIERARQEGVSHLVLPNIDSKTIQLVDALREAYPETAVPLMGLHPTHVKDDWENELKLIFKALNAGVYAGVGEIGIDLYWDKTHFEQQVIAFEQQVKYALEKDMPVVIHARDSFNELFESLERINAPLYKGIFHAFTGSVEDAQKIQEMGFLIGIGGIVTFKNSGLAEVVKHIDLNHIVLETDSPYLAPTPFRGKRNESSYVKLVAQKIAEVKACSLEEVAEATTASAKKLFNL